MRNWAGNVTYSASRVLEPRSVEEAQELVAETPRIRALGTRHSFTRVADFDGVLLSTEHLNGIADVGERTVTVEAGIRYGELGSALRANDLAVANFASLPHISVGGAIATATHGSGVRNPSLASAVAELELIDADGELLTLRRGERDFDGAVVSLGELGIVARVTLDVVPEFELRQYVFERLAWDAPLDEILGAAYSVSLFTMWTDAGIDQVWVKTTDELSTLHDATPATTALHPVLGGDPVNCTDQLGVPGPSADRLPHFRLGFTPSGGDELQTEYVVAREHGTAVIEELRKVGPRITPLLLTSEIRTIAADAYWLSPFYERDSTAFHFTWKPMEREVLSLLPAIERALEPFDPRPHWGKVFLATPSYPKDEEFAALRERLDPKRKFRGDFLPK